MAILLNSTKNKNYSDLDLDFFKHPTTSDVVIKTGNEAIKRSIRNLIFTNYYDRPFRSYIGSNIRKILFENMEPFTSQYLEDAIKLVIDNFEPRVRIEKVKVISDIDRHGFDVELQYTILNSEQLVTTSLFLERVR